MVILTHFVHPHVWGDTFTTHISGNIREIQGPLPREDENESNRPVMYIDWSVGNAVL